MHTIPGQISQARCAKRTRAELIEYAPRRPLAFQDELQLRWMSKRCGTCRACPMVLQALSIMLPPPELPSAVIIKLAGWRDIQAA